MKTNKLKLLLRIGLIVATALSISSCLIGRYMCNYALLPQEHGNDLEGDRIKIEKRYPGLIGWYDALCESKQFKDSCIIGEGGYKLHTIYSDAACGRDNAKGTAIVIHGYTDNHLCFLNLVKMYRDDLGYNVLVPDLHYHGLSEGRAVQMGWLDRLDIMRWIDVAHNIWGDDFMVIHGVSMGAATTMMVSGEHLPEYVKAFVEDCGYSSVWDQYKHNLKQMFHLPPFPVLTSASIVCSRRYGWDFKEASCVNQLSRCDRPMLFIHGDADDFVPFEHLQKVYDAKTLGYKEMWVAKGSEHAMAYRDYPQEYTEKVKQFLNKVRDNE